MTDPKAAERLLKTLDLQQSSDIRLQTVTRALAHERFQGRRDVRSQVRELAADLVNDAAGIPHDVIRRLDAIADEPYPELAAAWQAVDAANEPEEVPKGDRLEDDAPAGRRISDIGDETALADGMRAAMLRKLERNRGKLHWRDAEVRDTYLINRLREELMELEEAVASGSAQRTWDEAADVANFAAMLADRRKA